jgi:hypothetical protein
LNSQSIIESEGIRLLSFEEIEINGYVEVEIRLSNLSPNN